jgi:hypothetical protein
MTNCEKLNEVFGDFMSEMSNMDDFRKWLASEYVEKSKSVRRREDIQKEEEPVQFDEERDGQITFLKDKDLYHFEGWASWNDENGYPYAETFDMYTQAKSEAQAINNIKARIKKQNGWPMNKRIDIGLNDGASILTKVMPPISQYKIIYPNGCGVEILVNARNIQDVCKKLDKCGIPWKENDAEIKLGNIAE